MGNLSDSQRKNLIIDLVNKNRWAEALHHAVLADNDVLHELPSMHKDGIPEDHLNRMLDYLNKKNKKGMIALLAGLSNSNLKENYSKDTIRNIALKLTDAYAFINEKALPLYLSSLKKLFSNISILTDGIL